MNKINSAFDDVWKRHRFVRELVVFVKRGGQRTDGEVESREERVRARTTRGRLYDEMRDQGRERDAELAHLSDSSNGGAARAPKKIRVEEKSFFEEEQLTEGGPACGSGATERPRRSTVDGCEAEVGDGHEHVFRSCVEGSCWALRYTTTYEGCVGSRCFVSTYFFFSHEN